MGKILYPVGTKVTLRKFYNDATRVSDGLDHLVVKDYIKGSDNPYVVTCPNVGYDNETRYSVEELVKWETMKKKYPDQYNAERDGFYFRHYGPAREVSQDANRDALKQPESSACNCYTREEVDVLLAQQWEAIVQMLSNVDGVAMEALRNTHMIAERTDRNFMKVAKHLKTLNHDDD